MFKKLAVSPKQNPPEMYKDKKETREERKKHK